MRRSKVTPPLSQLCPHPSPLPSRRSQEFNNLRSRRQTDKVALAQTLSWTWAYSLSIPGSIMVAWPRMRTAEAPTSQKKVLNGDANQRSGMPITKRPV